MVYQQGVLEAWFEVGLPVLMAAFGAASVTFVALGFQSFPGSVGDAGVGAASAGFADET